MAVVFANINSPLIFLAIFKSSRVRNLIATSQFSRKEIFKVLSSGYS